MSDEALYVVYTPATAPEVETRGAIYLEECGGAKVDDAEHATAAVRSSALAAVAAERLRSVLEAMVGREFRL